MKNFIDKYIERYWFSTMTKDPWDYGFLYGVNKSDIAICLRNNRANIICFNDDKNEHVDHDSRVMFLYHHVQSIKETWMDVVEKFEMI